MVDRKYTGKGVAIQLAGMTVGTADAKINRTRNTITRSRQGKESPIQYPGSLLISGEITNIYMNGSLMAKIINATALGAVAKTLITSQSLNTPGAITLSGTDAGNGYPVFTIGGATTATATYLTTQGKNLDNADMADYVYVPAGTTVGTAFKAHYPHKTMTSCYNSTGAGTGVTVGCAVSAGPSSVIPGRPEFFTLTGTARAEDGTGSITFTANNVWIEDGSLAFGDVDAWISQVLKWKIMDADADYNETYVD